MNVRIELIIATSLLLLIPGLQIGCSRQADDSPPTVEELTERGRYLVTVGGCHDCHTPKLFSPQGMELNEALLLSGHQEDASLPQIDPEKVGPGKWLLINEHLTAAVGPWGVSFAINLTPDEETGIGAWTELAFVNAMRTGRHLGSGRPILPPMPWQNLAAATDEDLKAIFTYLQSIPPVKNRVPDPIPPTELGSVGMEN